MKGTVNTGNTGNTGNKSYSTGSNYTKGATQTGGSAGTGSTVNLVMVGDTIPTTSPQGKTLRTALANIFTGGNNRTVKRSIGGRTIEVSLKDIGGQESETSKLNQQSYTNTDTFLLTFGFNSPESLEDIQTWFTEAKRSAPKAALVLLGVKEKTGGKDVVTSQDVQQLAKTLNINTFAECSLDNPKSIEQAFDKAINVGTQKH